MSVCEPVIQTLILIEGYFIRWFLQQQLDQENGGPICLVEA